MPGTKGPSLLFAAWDAADERRHVMLTSNGGVEIKISQRQVKKRKFKGKTGPSRKKEKRQLAWVKQAVAFLPRGIGRTFSHNATNAGQLLPHLAAPSPTAAAIRAQKRK